MPPGVEFVVTFASEPALYVVKRQFRESPEAAAQQAFYYVLFGNIYQAPSLHACIQARARRCSHNIGAAFQQLKRDLEPLAWRERQRFKRLRLTGAAALPDVAAASGAAAAQQADAVLTVAAAAADAGAGAPAADDAGAAQLAPAHRGQRSSLAAGPSRERQGTPLNASSADASASARAHSAHVTTGSSATAAAKAVASQAGAQGDVAATVAALEREAAKGNVQQPPITAEGWQWVQRTDDVILNVLARCACSPSVHVMHDCELQLWVHSLSVMVQAPSVILDTARPWSSAALLTAGAAFVQMLLCSFNTIVLLHSESAARITQVAVQIRSAYVRASKPARSRGRKQGLWCLTADSGVRRTGGTST